MAMNWKMTKRYGTAHSDLTPEGPGKERCRLPSPLAVAAMLPAAGGPWPGGGGPEKEAAQQEDPPWSHRYRSLIKRQTK